MIESIQIGGGYTTLSPLQTQAPSTRFTETEGDSVNISASALSLEAETLETVTNQSFTKNNDFPIPDLPDPNPSPQQGGGS